LKQSSTGSSVLATAHRLLELQRHVRAVLPPPLNATCQVLRWQDGILMLGVPTAAHSAKLRQVVPRLAASLQGSGWQVNEIRVRVQAATLAQPPVAPRAPHERPFIAPDGVQAFARLREALPEGPLAQAVARLVQRRT